MPTSDSNQVPAVLKLVGEGQPATILDIGVGWGKYGTLFRTALEQGYPDISDRVRWRVRIDGVEPYTPYIGAIQRAVYNELFLEPIEAVLPRLGEYDVIFMGDVLEHFPAAAGLALLQQLVAKARQRVVLSTPNGRYDQGALFGNELERHQSAWVPEDFRVFPHHEVYASRKSIIAVLARDPIPATGRRWRLASYPRRPVQAALGAWLQYRRQRLSK